VSRYFGWALTVCRFVGIVTIAAFDCVMSGSPAPHCLAWASGGFVIHRTDRTLWVGLTELFWVSTGLGSR
jgi:hypothetical protein